MRELSIYKLREGDGRRGVILLHGFMGNSLDWERVVHEGKNAWGNAGVFAFDLPGHGNSVNLPSEKYTFQRTLSMIEEAILKLSFSSVVVAGYSLGGRLALGMAVEKKLPLAGLILISASPGLQTEQEREVRRSADERMAQKLEACRHRESFARFLEDWWKQPIFGGLLQKKGMQEYLMDSRLEQDPRELAQALRGMTVGCQLSYWNHLSNVDVPCLVLAGAMDAKFCHLGEEMNSRLPQGRFIKLEESAHMLLLERPEIFSLQSVMDWVAQLD